MLRSEITLPLAREGACVSLKPIKIRSSMLRFPLANNIPIGAGPGYHVAERSLAVSIMRILWAFDVKPSSTAKLPLDPSDYRGQPPGNPNNDLPVNLVLRSGKSELVKKAFNDALQARAPMVRWTSCLIFALY
jgi:hypothetical protein